MSQACVGPKAMGRKCTKAMALKCVFGITNEITVVGDGLCWLYSVLTIMGLMTTNKTAVSRYMEQWAYPDKITELVEWVKTVCNKFRKQHKPALLAYNADSYSRWSTIRSRFAEGAHLWGNSGSLCVLAGVFDITIVVWSDQDIQITPTPYKCQCNVKCLSEQCQRQLAKFA